MEGELHYDDVSLTHEDTASSIRSMVGHFIAAQGATAVLSLFRVNKFSRPNQRVSGSPSGMICTGSSGY